MGQYHRSPPHRQTLLMEVMNNLAHCFHPTAFTPLSPQTLDTLAPSNPPFVALISFRHA